MPVSQRGGGLSQNFSMPQSVGMLGQVLDGKYRIEARLGSGGMGDVYRATRLLIGDSVAIKILHPHLARDPQAAERFRREAVTATQLRHRNVVAIYDVGISAAHNVPYILMELAEGFSLRQIIKEYGTLPLDFVVTVAAQVCAALDEAHRLGIVHRDIKPENIIAHQTTTGWQIKILDFGIAKLYNQGDIGLTQDGTSLGTPQYMSPEQCLGQDLDGRSDVYSAGIVLYEMLCGTVPFKSPTASAIAIYQVQSAPTRLIEQDASIDLGVEAVILKSLEKHPDARQQSASALSQELIKAATAAFKSGKTAISAVPIAAPEVEPELDAHVSGQATDSSTNTSKASDEEVVLPLERGVESSAGKLLDETQVVEIVDSAKLGEMSEDLSTEVETVSSEHTESPSASIPHGPSEESDHVPQSGQYLDAVPQPMEDLEDIPAGEAAFDAEASSALPRPESGVSSPITGEHSDLQLFNEGELSGGRPGKTISIIVAAGVLFAIFAGGFVWWNYSGSNTASAEKSTSSNVGQPSASLPNGMAYIPGGEFMMGSDTGHVYSQPAHRVAVSPFYIDITEVTNEEYKKFLDATGTKDPPKWKNGQFPEGEARFPATGIDWEAASAYAAWARKRLPTEAEWEFAARGADGRIYPWGNEWKDDCANAKERYRGMREVGTASCESPFGLVDMIGNAWEWTSDDAKAYPGGKDFDDVRPKAKVIRGGYWGSKTKEDTNSLRRGAWGATGEEDYSNTGFRCVKDVEAR